MSISPASLLEDQSNLYPLETLPPLPVEPDLVTDPNLVPVARKLSEGKRLDFTDGMTLMTTTDLLGLGHLADKARRHKNRDLAYYVVNRHLNYSNVCVNGCAFCAFQRKEGQPGGYLLSPEEAAEKVREPAEMQVDELHVVGSCHPSMQLEYYEDLLRAIGRARPEASIKAFTPVEIDHMAKVSGVGPGEVLDRLKQAGLVLMPGGGAEVFSPRVRKKLCPRKISGEKWLEIAGLAHQKGIPTNATMLYGHIETPEDRVEHLLALRDQQDISGGFNSFIPLAFHSDNTGLAGLSRTTGLDDLRVIAASRLLLDNFPHIKAYWIMLSTKLAQVALNFGADDMDGTIVEERISHMAGATTAQGLTESQLAGMIKASGFVPARRDSFYNVVSG